MGAGRAKAFLPLAGRPLLLRAAEAFEAAPEVEAIVAVVPAGEQRAAHDLLAPLRKVVAVVAGGATVRTPCAQDWRRCPRPSRASCSSTTPRAR